MQYLGGLFASMPSFSGRRNSINSMAPGLLQSLEREKAEKARQEQLARQKKLDEQNQLLFGYKMHDINKGINDQAIKDQATKEASFLLGPDSSRAPSKYAGMSSTDKNRELMSKGLLSGNAGITNYAAKQMQPTVVSPGQTLLDSDHNPLFTAPNRPSANADPALVKEFKFAKQQGFKGDFNHFIQAKKGNGITVSPDGTVQIGGGSSGNLQKSTRTQLEKDALNSIDVMAQVKEMKSNFKPEFQRIGHRYDMYMSNLGDKFKDVPFIKNFVKDIDPEERVILEDFARHRADNLKLFTKTLSDLSGAAVTASEAKRAEGWFPKVGTGIFDGDSPTEYSAKMRNFEQFTRNALIRQQYALENGLKWQNISLDSVPDIIEQEGDKLMLKYANMPEDQAKAAVKRDLKIKYGNLM